MSRAQMLVTLALVYAGTIVAIAAWAHRRTHHPNDYLVANRRGGMFLVGLSQALNLLPAWLMLVLSASAFTWGLAAVWAALAIWLGGLVQAAVIAPRVRQLAAGQHSYTLTQLLSCESGERIEKVIARGTSFLIGIATVAMIIVQLQLLDVILAPSDVTDPLGLIMLGAFLICVGTAGWWAFAALETLQAVLVLLVVMFIALLAYAALGGWEEIALATEALEPAFVQWDGGRKPIVTIAFIGGSMSLGALMLGQPALQNRAIAARDERTARTSGIVLMLWLTLLLPALLTVGWLARVLYSELQQPELAVLEITRRSLHPAVAVTAAVIMASAVLANVVAQLSTLSAMLVNDLRPRKSRLHPEWSRAWTVVLVMSVLVILHFARKLSLSDALFCWTVLGAALGPLLLVRLAGKRVRGGSIIGAMSAGVLLVCVFHVMPDAPGDFLERVLPFVAGLGIALTGGERRRNPDRADRAEKTVHDRLPI
jgi:Na+/proline symporter